MSLNTKGFSQQTSKTPTFSNTNTNSLYSLKSANRPNSTIGNPMYPNKVHSKSIQYSLKRTSSNSILENDINNVILNGSPKLNASPTKIQIQFKRSDSNTVTEVGSPTKLKIEKKNPSDKDTLVLKQKTKSANKTGTRYVAKENSKPKEALEVSYSSLKSGLKQNGRQSTTSSKKLLHEGITDKSLLSELSMGWNKSISYGIVDVDPPVSTRKPLKTDLKNKKPAPILVVNCELAVKEEKDKDISKTVKKEIKSTTPTNPKKSINKENSAKKASPKNEVQISNVIKPINLRESVQSPKKNNIKSKENKPEVVKPKGKDDKSPLAKSIQVSSKKSPTKLNKQSVIKPKGKPLREIKEPQSLSTLPKNSLETSLDISLMSSSFIQEVRPLTTKLTTSINSSNSFFSTKSVNNSKQRPQSPGSTKSVLLPTNDPVNIQPSKHSEFSFKMTYFKPIEDKRLDEFIRDINGSQHLTKKIDRTMSITNEKICDIEKPPETFCVPLPSSQALETQRPGLNDTNKQNTQCSVEMGQMYHKKSFSTVKKTPNCQAKNPNNLALKSSMQGLGIAAQRVNDSRVRGGRQSLEEISKEMNKGSPLSKGKLSRTPNEKPLVRDEKIKIESKNKNNFSKLDRILQEMKENPSIMINDENCAPYIGDSEGGLFNQGSRIESTSSSTNCSLNKSFANTLRKITISHSEY